MDDITPAQGSKRQPRSKAAQQRQAADAKTNQKSISEGTKRGPGQPTKFTRELWEAVLDRLACCENIIDICDDPAMPCYATFRKWYQKDEELKKEIEAAWVEASYLNHYVNDNILRKGSRSTGDFRRDEAIVANNRWFMGKTSRRVFGERTQTDQQLQVTIAMPDFAFGKPLPPVAATQVINGEIVDVDPDALPVQPSTPVRGPETPVQGPDA